jgi:hypothetical protein
MVPPQPRKPILLNRPYPGLLPAALVVALLAVPFITACSSRQMYGSGQGWQRTECNKISDLQERNRCLKSANTSYEEYQRQADAAKNPK